MLKETEPKELIGFFIIFLSLVAFQLGKSVHPGHSLATPMILNIEEPALFFLSLYFCLYEIYVQGEPKVGGQ